MYKPKAKTPESSLPVALVQYLADYPHIRKVVLWLDNDSTGRIATTTIKTLLSKKYAVTVEIQSPPQGKDAETRLDMLTGAVLNISPSELAVTRIKNSEELCYLLVALENECGIKLSPQSDNAKAIYELRNEMSK